MLGFTFNHDQFEWHDFSNIWRTRVTEYRDPHGHMGTLRTPLPVACLLFSFLSTRRSDSKLVHGALLSQMLNASRSQSRSVEVALSRQLEHDQRPRRWWTLHVFAWRPSSTLSCSKRNSSRMASSVHLYSTFRSAEENIANNVATNGWVCYSLDCRLGIFF